MRQSVNKIVLVKFKKAKAPYNPGETAGFPPHIAERFVKAGVADYAQPEKSDEESTTRRRRLKQETTEPDGKGYVTK